MGPFSFIYTGAWIWLQRSRVLTGKPPILSNNLLYTSGSASGGGQAAHRPPWSLRLVELSEDPLWETALGQGSCVRGWWESTKGEPL